MYGTTNEGIIRDAFYGYVRFFDTERKELEEIDKDENWDLFLNMMNGCFRSVEFLKRCYNLPIMEIADHELFDLVVANDLSTTLWCNHGWHDFKYANYETCTKMVANGINYGPVAFICVLYDWKDLYRQCILTCRSKKAYSLALYLKREFYVAEQEKLEWREEDKERNIDDSYCLRKLNTNNRELETNLWPHVYGPWDSILDCYDETEAMVEGDQLDDKYFTKYNIVNNFDIAYKAYERGDRSNCVLSKLICTAPWKIRDLYKEYRPFLVFCRTKIDNLWWMEKINPLVKYNVLYINMMCAATIDGHFYREEEIELPEYNLYVLAKRLRNKRVEKRILELYEVHKKLYKIMDLENETYLSPYEEIFELPEPDNIDLITGEELNPYYMYK